MATATPPKTVPSPVQLSKVWSSNQRTNNQPPKQNKKEQNKAEQEVQHIMPKDRVHINRRPTPKGGLDFVERHKVRQAWNNCEGDSRRFPPQLNTLVTWTCFGCNHKTKHTAGCRFKTKANKLVQRPRSKSSPPCVLRRMSAAAAEQESEIAAAAAAAAEHIAASVELADDEGLDDEEEVTVEDSDHATAEDATEDGAEDEGGAVDASLLDEEEDVADEDEIVEKERDVHPDQMAFALKFAEERSKTLPRMKGIELGEPFVRELTVHHQSDYHCFPAPDFTGKIVPDAAAFLLREARLMFFDVPMMYAKYCRRKKMCCVACGSVELTRIGWKPGLTVVQGPDAAAPTLLRVVNYMHKECPVAIAQNNNKRNSTFTGLHHKLWANYDPIIHDIYPFLLRKYPIKRSIARNILTLKSKGTSMRLIGVASSTATEEHLLGADLQQQRTLEAAARNPLTAPAVRRAVDRGRGRPVSSIFTNTKYTRVRSRKVAADCAKKEIGLQKPLWIAFMLLLGAVAICWDHTFWVAAQASSQGDTKSKPFIALFSVVSEIGEIIFYKFTRSKAHDELRKPLMKLRHNLDRNNRRIAAAAALLAGAILVAGGVAVAAGAVAAGVALAADRSALQSTVRVVSTDAPRTDAGLAKGTFGPETIVQMDRFHVFQIIYLHLKGHPERKILMSTLRKHSFQLIVEDVRRKARELIVAKRRRDAGHRVTRVPGGQLGMPEQGSLSDSEYEERVMGFVKRHWRRYKGDVGTALRVR